ncbi:ferrous iron transport protein A [Cupriavidus cauae]|uniref:FeoA family protein n=1 Tax=Cupriavidus TaxID=106589 RepID=UPI001CF5A76D|nr:MULTISPECIES: FeoA family protein [Cupriavidus]MCA7083650.1 ferrous iron transport protein A [Cupriavidus sp. DB3]UZN50779.1 ferrous iron transport protein A [Cupriavidus cauae]
MRLSDLPRRTAAIVLSVDDSTPNDPIARRLRELGFVPGEAVQIITFGPFGKDPLVAQVGSTRFALRRAEAARVTVQPEGARTANPAAASNTAAAGNTADTAGTA